MAIDFMEWGGGGGGGCCICPNAEYRGTNSVGRERDRSDRLYRQDR